MADHHTDPDPEPPRHGDTSALPPEKRQWEEAFLSQDPERVAHRFVTHLFHTSTHCNWCFDRRRIPHGEYDEARINAKDKTSNAGTIDSWGIEYEREDDGTLSVVSATSGPDPRTYHDVVDGRPKKLHEDDDRWEVPDGYLSNPRPREPPRPKTICADCARIDVDPTEDRTNREMIRAIRNLVDAARETGFAVNKPAAEGLLREVREKPVAQGKDRMVLERSLAFGFKKADGGFSFDPDPDPDPGQ